MCPGGTSLVRVSCEEALTQLSVGMVVTMNLTRVTRISRSGAGRQDARCELESVGRPGARPTEMLALTLLSEALVLPTAPVVAPQLCRHGLPCMVAASPLDTETAREVMWTPDPAMVEQTAMRKFQRSVGVEGGYDELWKWYAEFKDFSFVFRMGGEPWFSYNFHVSHFRCCIDKADHDGSPGRSHWSSKDPLLFTQASWRSRDASRMLGFGASWD